MSPRFYTVSDMKTLLNTVNVDKIVSFVNDKMTKSLFHALTYIQYNNNNLTWIFSYTH